MDAGIGIGRPFLNVEMQGPKEQEQGAGFLRATIHISYRINWTWVPC